MDFIESTAPQQQQAAPVAGPEMIEQASAPMGAGLGAVEQNPAEAPEEGAAPEEQKAYEDFFLRVMASIHDVREVPTTGKSMADTVVQMLSNPRVEPWKVIGQTAGLVLAQHLDNAKRQKVKIAPDVAREVGLDLVLELYQLAQESGAIKNLPDDEEPEGQQLMQLASMEAAKAVGEHMLKTGQANPAASRKEMEHQMEREAQSGELDDWGMEQFDPSVRAALATEIGDITRGN